MTFYTHFNHFIASKKGYPEVHRRIPTGATVDLENKGCTASVGNACFVLPATWPKTFCGVFVEWID
jgi:hypothetical protein